MIEIASIEQAQQLVGTRYFTVNRKVATVGCPVCKNEPYCVTHKCCRTCYNKPYIVIYRPVSIISNVIIGLVKSPSFTTEGIETTANGFANGWRGINAKRKMLFIEHPNSYLIFDKDTFTFDKPQHPISNINAYLTLEELLQDNQDVPPLVFDIESLSKRDPKITIPLESCLPKVVTLKDIEIAKKHMYYFGPPETRD